MAESLAMSRPPCADICDVRVKPLVQTYVRVIATKQLMLESLPD